MIKKNFKGIFITLEGMECSGKTTQIKKIKKKYKKRIVLTREPGGTKLSEKIRRLIMKNKMSPSGEAYLFASARTEHMEEKIIPALEEGKMVLCDRFVDSSIVYQGIIKGLGVETVLDINNNAIRGYMPDLTIFIDITIDEMYRRMANRKEEEQTRFDREKKEFHEKVREGYHTLARLYPERVKIVNGMVSEDELSKTISDLIESIEK